MTMRADELWMELDQPGAKELLRSATLARLAYAGRDELPRVIPIGFHWDGKLLFVCTAPIAPKVAALAERPDVALTIDVPSSPTGARSLLIRGTAAIEIVDGVAPEYLAAATKSMEGAELETFEEAVRTMYRQMARIAITPRWARYYDFGAGRMPAFLRELADAATSG